jgi:hypothetical protein
MSRGSDVNIVYSGQSNQGLFEVRREKVATEDTRYKDFSDRGTNTYERDEKKKEKIFFFRFFTKPSPKLSFTLMIVFEAGIVNANPRRSLNFASNNQKLVKIRFKEGYFA